MGCSQVFFHNFVIVVANLRHLLLTCQLIPSSVFAGRSALHGNQANRFHRGVRCHYIWDSAAREGPSSSCSYVTSVCWKGTQTTVHGFVYS